MLPRLGYRKRPNRLVEPDSPATIFCCSPIRGIAKRRNAEDINGQRIPVQACRAMATAKGEIASRAGLSSRLAC
jgi:hypothetical protein